MTGLSEQQQKQERQYSFPHHYIPKFRNGFRTAVYSSYGLRYAHMLSFILNQLRNISFDSLCDVGCGDGRLLMELGIEFPDKRLRGIDYSQRAINLARGLNPAGNYLQADITERKIGEKFDILTLIEVFEHIPPEAYGDFITGLHALLKDEGYLILTVPHRNVRVSKKHYQHFTKDRLLAHFEPTFNMTEVHYLMRSSLRMRLFYRHLLKNKLFILNNKMILNHIFRSFTRHSLYSSEKRCTQIFMILKKG